MPVPAPEYEPDQFFDFSRDLFCIAGFDGYYKLVNASFERVLGYSREELMSRPFMALVHPDDLERSRDAFSHLAGGEDVIGFAARLVCADGSARWFEWNTRTMPHLGVLYAIGRDVTDRSALAEEQAALRRVATLVARESSPDVVFAAVAEEVSQLLRAESTWMFRYEDDGTATLVASCGEFPAPIPVGTCFPLGGNNISSSVFRTAKPARLDDYADATGAAGTAARDVGVHSAVGVPIVVDGRLWGAIGAGAPAPLPQGTESRMGEFTELVATAIANIDAHAELTASRARIMTAADEERRRVVRDLHDGAQQRLVHAVITLKLAQRALQPDDAASALVAEALQQTERATVELRELAHGILPAVLTHSGLRAGVHVLASRMPLPVENGVSVGRLPAAVEATAYFVVCEALTNIAKHARAEHAEVTARIEQDTLTIQVRDDGVGGARPEGSGLQGLGDRLAALDGRLQVKSPADGGTLVSAAIPIPPSAIKR